MFNIKKSKQIAIKMKIRGSFDGSRSNNKQFSKKIE